MILAVDHLAWNVADTDEAVASLEKQGFELAFAERSLPNESGKRRLLTNYRPLHDLVFMRPASGTPIEITNHGPTLSDDTGPFLYGQGYLTLRTPKVRADRQFLTALRFREVDQGSLKLVSPVPNWGCQLELQEDPGQPTCMLDATGFPCLALLSNNLVDDAEKARQCGAWDFTEIFTSMVHGRMLQIVMMRAPGGSIFELIQIAHGAKN